MKEGPAIAALEKQELILTGVLGCSRCFGSYTWHGLLYYRPVAILPDKDRRPASMGSTTQVVNKYYVDELYRFPSSFKTVGLKVSSVILWKGVDQGMIGCHCQQRSPPKARSCFGQTCANMQSGKFAVVRWVG